MWFVTLRIIVDGVLSHKPWNHKPRSLRNCQPIRKPSSPTTLAYWTATLILFRFFSLPLFCLWLKPRYPFIQYSLPAIFQIHLPFLFCSQSRYPCFCWSVTCPLLSARSYHFPNCEFQLIRVKLRRSSFNHYFALPKVVTLLLTSYFQALNNLFVTDPDYHITILEDFNSCSRQLLVYWHFVHPNNSPWSTVYLN